MVCVLVCDSAGPGFDRSSNANPRTAAHHSQCIHTNSKRHGTEERNCDQNWILGNCGQEQPAAGLEIHLIHLSVSQIIIFIFLIQTEATWIPWFVPSLLQLCEYLQFLR